MTKIKSKNAERLIDQLERALKDENCGKAMLTLRILSDYVQELEHMLLAETEAKHDVQRLLDELTSAMTNKKPNFGPAYEGKGE